MALESKKVAPKVDFFSLCPMDDGMNVGPRDDILHLALSLVFQMERICHFSSSNSTSVALKSSSRVEM